jgi:hypothetical protein
LHTSKWVCKILSSSQRFCMDFARCKIVGCQQWQILWGLGVCRVTQASSEDSVTCHNFDRDMPRSEIPVDVLLNILDYVDKAGLAIMCRVNKICCSCSQDVLYRDIQCDIHMFECVHRTLAQSTHLARKVRSYDPRYCGSDLAMALRNMTSLRILKLPPAFNMDILDDCTFKLDSFECSYLNDYRESFPKFISSQPSLKDVTLVSFGSTVPSLEATCLPNLTRMEATFPWLPYLIPGRPLNEVILTGYTLNEHSIDYSFFALSTTPIRKLTIDYSYVYPTPVHLLASFLPSLTHFTLTLWNYFTSFKNEGVRGLALY